MSTEKENTPGAAASAGKPEKKILLTLLALTAVLAVTVLMVFYIVPYYGFSGIHPSLPRIMGWLMGGLGAAVVSLLALVSVVVVLGHDVPHSRKVRSLGIKVLLPILTIVGKLIGLRKEEIQHAFVAVNNELVLAQCRNGAPPRSILLLMPHCLQDKDCTVKITHRAENCKRCGKCPIKDLLDLSGKYGVNMAVATGGTFARRIVIETRPDLIIAVACERDLTSGIQDTTPLPVYGIFNERPFGPCVNTRVAIEHVEAVLRDVTAKNRHSHG